MCLSVRTRVTETLAAGAGAGSSSPDDESEPVLPVRAESGDGSEEAAVQMEDSLDLKDLDDAPPPDPPLEDSPVKSARKTKRSKPIAKRSFPFSSQSSVPLVLNPSRGSEMEIDHVKASEDEDWLGSDKSSPKDKPLCLDIVPYAQRAAMEAENEGNPDSEPSPPPEEDDWEQKWNEGSIWNRNSWMPMTQRRGNNTWMDSEREENSISIFDMNGPEEEEPAPRWYNASTWEQRPPWPYHRENRIRIIESTGVGAGLKNLGNTCFINAILQCFTHTVPLVLGLQTSDHEKPCARHKEGFCMLCALRDHMDRSLNSSGSAVSPSIFFENLSYISSFFQKYQQEDAHEFLQCLLDRLESCCAQPNSENDNSRDDNLVKQVFGGRLVSKLRCCNCGHCSETYEPLVDFSLEIEDVDSLESAIESFTKVEKLEDPDAKIKCGNCNEEVAMEKQLLLDQAPLVATFHLKRFKGGGGLLVEKIAKPVEYPLQLDLQPYTITKEENNVELKYQLYAVVEHSGYSPTAGHYISYIRSSQDTWHTFNDSRVYKVEGEKVLLEEAYLLFYVRQDIPWFSDAVKVKAPCSVPPVKIPSPKSVLETAESASTSSAEAGTSNESKDGPVKTQTLFTCNSKNTAAPNESTVAADVTPMQVSPEAKESEKINESGPDISMFDAFVPPRLNDWFEGFPEEKTCSVSPLSENDINKARNSNGASQKPSTSKSSGSSSQIPRKFIKLEQLRTPRRSPKKHLLDIQRRGTTPKKLQNKLPTDSQTNEAIRYAKKMPSSRGSKIIKALLERDDGCNVKRRTGSSPCKKPSPRRRHHNGNLISPVLR